MPPTRPTISQRWITVLALAIVGGGGLAVLAMLQGATLPALVIGINAIIISIVAMKKIQQKRQNIPQNPLIERLITPTQTNKDIISLYQQVQAQLTNYDYADALKTTNHLVKLDPDDPIAHYNRGLIFADQNAWVEALNAYSEALTRDSDMFAGYRERAQVYSQLKEWQNTLDDCNHALAKTSDATLYNLRGVAHFALGDFEESLKSYTQAITINDNNADFYNNRAVVKQKLDDLRGAIDDCRRAIALNPNLDTARKQMKRLQKQLS